MPTLGRIDVDAGDTAVGEVTAAAPQPKKQRLRSPPRGETLDEEKQQKKQRLRAVSSETLDGDKQPAAGSTKAEKKRKRSVLEELDVDDERASDANAADRSAMGEEENTKAAASDANASSGKKTGPKKKTIRDHFSLSPKMESGGNETTPVPTDASATKLTPKTRRVTAPLVALHDDALPIHVHVPFAGEAKRTEIIIESHCVDPKLFPGEKPIELSAGNYNPRTKKQMEHFLKGFGRYIH